MKRGGMVFLAAIAMTVVGAAPVAATFPGSNGKIAVVRLVLGTGSVVTTMNPDGSDPQRVYTQEGFRDFIHGTDWDADATRLVVNPCCSRRLAYRIVSIAPDGSDPVGVVERNGNAPAWSPDGAQIAYERFGHRDGSGFTSWIFIADADGSNATRFTGLRSRAAFFPAWSPDGASIAFSRSTNRQIVIKPVAGGPSTVIDLPGEVEYAEQLEWAPDGAMLSFVGYTCFGDCADIFTLDVASQTFTRLTRTNQAVETDADWSPDGSTIVFVRFTDAGFEDSDLWFMDSDGTNKLALESKRLEFYVDWATG